MIFASLTAWGSSGPDMAKPGYDIGAFWNATGMSVVSQMHQGNYSYYSTGMGDVTTGTGAKRHIA